MNCSRLKLEISQLTCITCVGAVAFICFTHLCKGGSSSLRLNGDGLRPALEDLVDVLLAEFGPFVLLVHYGPVRTASQQILDLLLRQLLLHSLRGKGRIKKLCKTKKGYWQNRF